VASGTGTGGSFGEAFRDLISSTAEPGRVSYTAKSARSQYKHLTRTARGRAALEQAGLTAAPQTIRRWRGGKQKPGKANSGIIAAAYRVMRQGGIPSSVKTGTMKIAGRVGTGSDVRDRGTPGNAELKINLSRGRWARIDAAWQLDGFASFSDEELEDLVSETLIEPDIGGSDWWYFPGGSYTITLS
jgi:hypothetical protein